MSKQSIAIIVFIVIFSSSILAIFLYGEGYFGDFSKESAPPIVDTDFDGLIDGYEQNQGTSPILVDSDGDGFLDGMSIKLNLSDELCQKLLEQKIVNRLFANGTYMFYGEQTFDSNPLEINSNGAYQTNFLVSLSHQEYQQLESIGIFSDYTFDEINQAKFLLEISEQEYQELESSGLLLDYDLDNDNMDNYFEKNIADLPYDLYNGRYAILVDALENSKTCDKMYNFLVNEQRYEPQNVRKLADVNATIENFKNAVSDFKQVIDRDCLLYVMLEAHGNINGIAFNDGTGNDKAQGLGYVEIGETLDSVNSSVTIVTVKACEKIGALERLKINSSPYVLGLMAGDFIFGSSENYVNDYTGGQQYDPIVRKDYDIDGNGFVSIGESYQIQMKSMERYLQDYPEQALKYGIFNQKLANSVYLGDFSNINCLTPDNKLASWNETD